MVFARVNATSGYGTGFRIQAETSSSTKYEQVSANVNRVSILVIAFLMILCLPLWVAIPFLLPAVPFFIACVSAQEFNEAKVLRAAHALRGREHVPGS